MLPRGLPSILRRILTQQIEHLFCLAGYEQPTSPRLLAIDSKIRFGISEIRTGPIFGHMGIVQILALLWSRVSQIRTPLAKTVLDTCK